jgi:P pilus assembly chaperone PapD
MTDLPLVLTPPVMKLEGKKQGKFRLVVLRGAIAQDRESAYWLSLQEIPLKPGAQISWLLPCAAGSKFSFALTD